jgi:FkbM family methyltransferase
VVDAGANFGYFTLNLACAIGPEGRVLALEPNPSSHERLRRHLAWNGFDDRVHTYGLGLSSRPETVRMSEPAGNTGHTAVASDGEIRNVSLTSLDELVAGEGLDRIDLLKLDVEGYEARALIGARGVLARFRPTLVVELFPSMMQRQGSSPEEVASILTDSGYCLFKPRRSRLVPLETLPSGDVGIHAFAFHRDRPGT